uniref:Uncharacterized protein n=1 Tax=Ditylenchus dipsaci TaxID=166011 RepID=A0A915E7T0_9BILA
MRSTVFSVCWKVFFRLYLRYEHNETIAISDYGEDLSDDSCLSLVKKLDSGKQAVFENRSLDLADKEQEFEPGYQCCMGGYDIEIQELLKKTIKENKHARQRPEEQNDSEYDENSGEEDHVVEDVDVGAGKSDLAEFFQEAPSSRRGNSAETGFEQLEDDNELNIKKRKLQDSIQHVIGKQLPVDLTENLRNGYEDTKKQDDTGEKDEHVDCDQINDDEAAKNSNENSADFIPASQNC